MTRSKTGWHMILYRTKVDSSGFVEEEKVDELGNFPNLGNRQADEIITFSGMFGIGDYFLWFVHKNIQNYDFSTLNIDLKLFLEGNKDAPFFHERYKIVDILYKPELGKYMVYGVSESTWLLNTKIRDLNIKQSVYQENRKPYEVLAELLDGIFEVEYHEHPDISSFVEYEYRQLTIDPDWTVLELINYVCDDNEYEFYTENKKIIISKEIQVVEGRNSTRPHNLSTDNISEGSFFRKVNGSSRPMNIMSHLSKVWRCIWCKHTAGASGGMSKGCFVRIGQSFNKWIYYQTLEGKIERFLGIKLLKEKKISYHTLIGNIQTDEGNEYIDDISVQLNYDSSTTRTPRDIKIDRESDGLIDGVKLTKKKVCRSTPYLDHEAGILFPSPKLDNPPPNSLIHNVEGREESSVVGNFIFGNGRDSFNIPSKNKGDFRLQFPNGWCLYVDEDGDTYLQIEDTNSQTIPSEDNSKINIHIKPDGTINLNQSENTNIKINNDSSIELNKDSNANIKINNDGSIELNKDANTYIKIDSSGNIELNTSGNVEIEGSSIKLGSAATLGVARLTDDVSIFAAFQTWLNTHIHSGVQAGAGVTGTPSVTFTGPQIGDISSSSSKVKSE